MSNENLFNKGSVMNNMSQLHSKLSLLVFLRVSKRIHYDKVVTKFQSIRDEMASCQSQLQFLDEQVDEIEQKIIFFSDEYDQRILRTKITNDYIPNNFDELSNSKDFIVIKERPHCRSFLQDSFDVSQLSRKECLIKGSQLYSKSQLTFILNSIFHISKFQNSQLDIIKSTLSQNDTFCIMKTGGGKSLCYQLPSYIESQLNNPKITLVISPLVSLIQDQMRLLNDIKIGLGECLVGRMKDFEVKDVWEKCWSINKTKNVGCLFVTPERVTKSGRLKGELEKLNQMGRLARFVIDECHCASIHGHDFRPSYAKLSTLKYHFPHIPILCLTATASSQITMDVCRILRLNHINVNFYRSGANRENLYYAIKMKRDSISTINDIVKFINDTYPDESGIIYALSRKEAEYVSGMLRQFGVQAHTYHSTIGEKQKGFIHEGWMQGTWKVVVATIAFGLGVHKVDVRYVIHYSLSKSLEAYYQESGRAGRDGLPAQCILYYTPKDVSRMFCMIHGEYNESSFYNMVHYSHKYGNSAICRNLILNVLGECPRDTTLVNSNVESRQVGEAIHKILDTLKNSHKNLTIQQLVGSTWKKYKKHCRLDLEHMIIDLLLNRLLVPKVTFTCYTGIVYLELSDRVVSSQDYSVDFPIVKNVLKDKIFANEIKDKVLVTSKRESTLNKNKKKISNLTIKKILCEDKDKMMLKRTINKGDNGTNNVHT